MSAPLKQQQGRGLILSRQGISWSGQWTKIELDEKRRLLVLQRAGLPGRSERHELPLSSIEDLRVTMSEREESLLLSLSVQHHGTNTLQASFFVEGIALVAEGIEFAFRMARATARTTGDGPFQSTTELEFGWYQQNITNDGVELTLYREAGEGRSKVPLDESPPEHQKQPEALPYPEPPPESSLLRFIIALALAIGGAAHRRSYGSSIFPEGIALEILLYGSLLYWSLRWVTFEKRFSPRWIEGREELSEMLQKKGFRVSWQESKLEQHLPPLEPKIAFSVFGQTVKHLPIEVLGEALREENGARIKLLFTSYYRPVSRGKYASSKPGISKLQTARIVVLVSSPLFPQTLRVRPVWLPWLLARRRIFYSLAALIAATPVFGPLTPLVILPLYGALHRPEFSDGLFSLRYGLSPEVRWLDRLVMEFCCKTWPGRSIYLEHGQMLFSSEAMDAAPQERLASSLVMFADALSTRRASPREVRPQLFWRVLSLSALLSMLLLWPLSYWLPPYSLAIATFWQHLFALLCLSVLLMEQVRRQLFLTGDAPWWSLRPALAGFLGAYIVTGVVVAALRRELIRYGWWSINVFAYGLALLLFAVFYLLMKRVSSGAASAPRG